MHARYRRGGLIHLIHDLSQELQLIRPEGGEHQQLPEQLHPPVLMNRVCCGLADQVGSSWVHLPCMLRSDTVHCNTAADWQAGRHATECLAKR